MNLAAIFAGGIGSRMHSNAIPKQFLEIHGKPIIVHTLEHFESHPEIDAIAVAILGEWRDPLLKLIKRYDLDKVRWVVDGGATGQESRHKVLEALALECDQDAIVLLHDGVRPLIDAQLISRNIEVAETRGAAVTCTKFSETLVSSEKGTVDSVIPRDHLYSAQAPQTFRLGEILDLYRRAVDDGIHDSVDSCSLMSHYGVPVHRIDGPRSNIKITTAEDFYVCRTFFELVENRQIAGAAR